MSGVASAIGLARSLAIYYGVPFRSARLRRFYSQFITRGGLCFDIGAHVGNRVRAWRRLGARVVAVEPQPQFVRILRWLYGSDEQVTIVAAAVGRAPGHADLLISQRTPTVSTLSRDWVDAVRVEPGFERVRWDARERVAVTTLDELIARFGEPQFVKIDVEGFEGEVLSGLMTPVPALSFEYLPVAKSVALECIARVEQLDRYEYNFSRGEQHRFALERWVPAQEMRQRLTEMRSDDTSGDIYARRS